MSQPLMPEPISCTPAMVEAPQAVLAAAAEACIAADTTVRVMEWNPAATRTLRWTLEQACGYDIAELIVPARLRPAHRAGLARLAAGRPGRVLGERRQLAALHRDGHESRSDGPSTSLRSRPDSSSTRSPTT
ncbi:PAS domain-containing protein [Dactylosporangium sp. CS-047395]|uniref:PAS domain-containing protein n=1 Tax=Dactylosporangium sp. CS-047395 TaxID=3239936 RepID=UPI003D8F3EE0